MTAPQPAGACFVLPAQRQSGAIKTAGNKPRPILHATARAHTLANARLLHRVEAARDPECFAQEQRRQKILECKTGAEEVILAETFVTCSTSREAELHASCFSFQMNSEWILIFLNPKTLRISNYPTEVICIPCPLHLPHVLWPNSCQLISLNASARV